MSSPDSIGYSNPTINDVIIPLEDLKSVSEKNLSETDKKVQKVRSCSKGDVLGCLAITSATVGLPSIFVGAGVWGSIPLAGPIITGVGVTLAVISIPLGCISICCLLNKTPNESFD